MKEEDLIRAWNHVRLSEEKKSQLKDTLRLKDSAEELSAAGDVKLIPFSSQTGLGADEIKQLIEEAINNV